MAAAAAAVAWAALDWIRTRKRPTALGIISGAVAGLVAITPASGYVTPLAAIAIGALAGLACYGAVMFMKGKLGYDDSLDAFGVHGIGGMLGALLHRALGHHRDQPGRRRTACSTADPSCCSSSSSRSWHRCAYSFVVSFGLLKLVDKFIGLRVSADNENIGLDLTQHSESAYTVVG